MKQIICERCDNEREFHFDNGSRTGAIEDCNCVPYVEQIEELKKIIESLYTDIADVAYDVMDRKYGATSTLIYVKNDHD